MHAKSQKYGHELLKSRLYMHSCALLEMTIAEEITCYMKKKKQNKTKQKPAKKIYFIFKKEEK